MSGDHRRRTGIDDDAANGRAVPTNPFGSAVHNDVRTMFNGSDQVA